MSIERKQLIYGNCQVFSPQGKLMFRCLEKRAKWYLDRNLAVKICDDPLSIRLTFQPGGDGESLEVLKAIRENKCVVCGEEDLALLTRHHIIPFEYRKHFPPDLKKHGSLFVVSICRDCHVAYETLYASKLKAELAKKHEAPMNGVAKTKKGHLLSIVNTFIKHGIKIPEDRYKIMKDDFILLAKELHLHDVAMIDLANQKSLRDLYLRLKNDLRHVPDTHGGVVVSQLTNLKDFEKMWMQHFVTTMSPSHLPQIFYDFVSGKASF